MGRKLIIFFVLILVVSGRLSAQAFVEEIRTNSAVDIKVACDETAGWIFNVTENHCAEGIDIVKVDIHRRGASTPPKFKILLEVPQKDIHNIWASCNDTPHLYADWGGRYRSNLAQSMPVYSYFNDNNENRLTMALDEPFRLIEVKAGIKEEGAFAIAEFSFFDLPEAPLDAYSVSLRLDSRNVFWSEPIKESAEWIMEKNCIEPCNVPEVAFEPLYSSWYQFHQGVSASEIEAESARAAEMGMKTIIVDDGWQTDDGNRGYAYCGDWKVSLNKFPDMASHVRNVQKLGLKYMMWYSVPFVGAKSAGYERFKDKFLYFNQGLGAGVLDPRFPEVREYLTEVYEKSLKDWNLDGFKLDFIDSFRLNGSDPAIRDDYAGRDMKSVQEAVDVLMKTIYRRLHEIKPDILIEFRQSYIGPAIRQYGNMLRAADCPGDMKTNKVRIADLRITSGTSAVHSDMLEWNINESPELVARNIINAIFGVVQYSVMLRDMPESHKLVIQNWLKFSEEHRSALLKGDFKPYHKETGYPLIEASDDKETIIAVYQDNLIIKIAGNLHKRFYVLNASGEEHMTLDVENKAKSAYTVDAYGAKHKIKTPVKGLSRICVPDGGYLFISYTN